MIECKKDTLIFRPQNAESVLKQHAHHYEKEWLPRVLAEDHVEVIDRLLANEFAWLSDHDREAARQAVLFASSDRVAVRFRDMVASRLESRKPQLEIWFKRTLRLPDDGKIYPLPSSLGMLPIRPIKPYANRLPEQWRKRGGVLVPMYQAEAFWMDFGTRYPCVLKVGTGMVNSISGQQWTPGLSFDPQNYLVLPEQEWLDGYCTEAGVVRQFIAADLGAGYTAEEQILGGTVGGVQLEAFFIKPSVYFEKQLKDELPKCSEDVLRQFLTTNYSDRHRVMFQMADSEPRTMSVGAGGKVRRSVYKDPWESEDWDLSDPARIWVHVCNAKEWFKITGLQPPQKPVTAEDYAKRNLAWFDYYRDDLNAVKSSSVFAKLKSVFSAAKEKGDASIPEEEPITVGTVYSIGPAAPKNAVSEWNGQ